MVLKVKINLTKLKAKCEDHRNSNLKSQLQTNNQKN